MEAKHVDPMVRALFDEIATLPLQQRARACQEALTVAAAEGERLRNATVYLLRRDGWTVAQIADLLGVVRRTVQDYTKAHEEATGATRVRTVRHDLSTYLALAQESPRAGHGGP